MNIFAVQFSAGHHPSGTNLLTPALALVAATCGGLVLLKLLEAVVTPLKRVVHVRSVRRHDLHAAATAELRARATMDALCPHGWQAEIVMYSSAEDQLDEAPDPSRALVALDWVDYREPTAMRRVWGGSLHEALEAMVADRVTDETLREIEQRALAEGVTWPDS